MASDLKSGCHHQLLTANSDSRRFCDKTLFRSSASDGYGLGILPWYSQCVCTLSQAIHNFTIVLELSKRIFPSRL